MKDINCVTLSGRLTRDPELRATASGVSVCQLGMAVNESYKDASGSWEERPNFIDVTVWGGQGENAAKYLGKGDRVMVSGRITQRSWEDDSGNRRSKVDVTADNILFPTRGERKTTTEPDFADEEIPF